MEEWVMTIGKSQIILDKIGQIAIPVSDIDRAIAFYQDVLGMEFLFKAPPGLGFFNCGGIRLLLDAPAWNNGEKRSSVIYYQVADIHRLTSELKKRGVVIETEPHLVAKMPDHDLWMSFFRDPDGNLLALMCEIREPEKDGGKL
jgi:methylmalonyl-CoA/ethylmalonyl-CoA epimerase